MFRQGQYFHRLLPIYTYIIVLTTFEMFPYIKAQNLKAAIYAVFEDKTLNCILLFRTYII
jgi:hypothetical protein